MLDVTNTMAREMEPVQTTELRLITTASTPATPGPSTPTLPIDQVKIGENENDIVPPARPSSTPFPLQEHLEGSIQSLPRNWRLDGSGLPTSPDTTLSPAEDPDSSPFRTLPIEIHERILDYLFGVRNPITARVKATCEQAKDTKALRNWGNELRHSRRREVSELSLVCGMWRSLIQDRLYRHIKIKATRESVNQAVFWFLRTPQLCQYVKHIEFWFPVFQQKTPDSSTVRIPTVTNHSNISRTPVQMLEPSGPVPYQAPNNNCTLEEVFRFVSMTFSEARVLSLEGGDRKKPPIIQHFLKQSVTPSLVVLPKITTLVCKGQWNIIRTDEHFQNIVAALPNLVEWHGAYARPKSKSYLCMASIFPKLPSHITHLNLTMENEFRRENMCPPFFRKVALQVHFCMEMAQAMPALEHFGYTGRVCGSFFDTVAALSSPRTSRLKSVELTVKNLCRPPLQWNDGSAITDMAFIYSFETLVHAAVRSLRRLAALDYVNIKFIDLDSVLPSWNPYFLLKNNTCLGMWSDPILESLEKSRPGVKWLECSESTTTFDCINWNDPQNLTRMRAKSLKVSSYISLSSGITIT